MIRLPHLRYDRILWVAFLLVVSLVLYVAIGRKKNMTPADRVIEITPLGSGDLLINRSDVENTLTRTLGSDMENIELAKLSVERIERVLEQNPFVLDAETYIDQNNVLHIKITQREPIVRVLDNTGGNYYMDKNGQRIPPSKNIAARVMVATGNVTPYTPDFLEQGKRPTTLKDLFTLTQLLLADEFLASFIQQIHVSDKSEFFLVPLVGDQKIELGKGQKLEDKLNRLKIFYQQGMPYAGWRKYETINLKYSGQVVCRK
jgi:cell division protein FtsQ